MIRDSEMWLFNEIHFKFEILSFSFEVQNIIQLFQEMKPQNVLKNVVLGTSHNVSIKKRERESSSAMNNYERCRFFISFFISVHILWQLIYVFEDETYF